MQYIDPTTLVPARLALHYAAQVLSAWADSWLPNRADDGHTSLRWERGALVGERDQNGHAFALRTIDFALVAQRDGVEIATLSLAGATLSDAMTWADRQHGAPRGMHMRGGDYDMPASDLATGAPFAPDLDALAALARWYDLGAEVIGRAVSSSFRTSTIRIWPHHFDLGAILYLDPGEIGVGLSPGDAYYAEPYFYVTPSPMPTAPGPLAGGGVWRRDGWQGAVLTARELGDPHAFVVSAIASVAAGPHVRLGE